MPIYTYHCDNCGITFDKRQSFSDEPLKVCPDCEETALHKVFQPVGIVFKGKGFYATDHRSSSGSTTSTGSDKKTGKEETKSESASSSTETKSETSSVTKADPK